MTFSEKDVFLQREHILRSIMKQVLLDPCRTTIRGAQLSMWGNIHVSRHMIYNQ
jgi:hypothetical protein